MLAMGVPYPIKTDNGPTYITLNLKPTSANWNRAHNMSILYDPQGQTIVKYTNTSLKKQLQKTTKPTPQEKQ